MKLPELGARLNTPAVFFHVRSAGVHHQSKNPAHTVVGATGQAQNIRHRSVAPGSVQLRGTHARRRAAHLPAYVKHAGLLDNYSGARWNRFQVHGPSAGAGRFDVTRNTDQRKRKLLFSALEIDSAGIYFNPPETNSWRGRSRNV